MTVSVITPTCDRPAAIRLLERWMARQTRKPDEWIVSDGGQVAAPCTMGQVHLHKRTPPGATNFANNLLRALEAVRGELIVIAEDDDWYAPTHLETIVGQLSKPGISMAGDPLQRYYNVAQRKWRIFNNKGASLCQTGFARPLIPALRAVIRNCLARKTYGVDGAFWAGQPNGIKSLERTDTVLGIKGLPGQVGLGVGHRPSAGWTFDPHGKQLRAWIGPDADVYVRQKAVA